MERDPWNPPPIEPPPKNSLVAPQSVALIAGLIYLPLHLFVVGDWIVRLLTLLEIDFTLAQLNLLYFSVGTVILLLVMRGYLQESQKGLFVQFDIGPFVILENGDVTPMLELGLRSGYRIPLGTFYIEPYGRLGYPFAFGIGVLAGIYF